MFDERASEHPAVTGPDVSIRASQTSEDPPVDGCKRQRLWFSRVAIIYNP